MKYSLIIQGANSPELLERLLRVCRHRGFSVQKINGETSIDEKSLHLKLTLCSARPISLLSKQLEKIYGISQVAVLEQEQNIKASA